MSDVAAGDKLEATLDAVRAAFVTAIAAELDEDDAGPFNAFLRVFDRVRDDRRRLLVDLEQIDTTAPATRESFADHERKLVNATRTKTEAIDRYGSTKPRADETPNVDGPARPTRPGADPNPDPAPAPDPTPTPDPAPDPDPTPTPEPPRGGGR